MRIASMEVKRRSAPLRFESDWIHQASQAFDFHDALVAIAEQPWRFARKADARGGASGNHVNF